MPTGWNRSLPGGLRGCPDGSVPSGVGGELIITAVTITTTCVCSGLSSLFFFISEISFDPHQPRDPCRPSGRRGLPGDGGGRGDSLVVQAALRGAGATTSCSPLPPSHLPPISGLLGQPGLWAKGQAGFRAQFTFSEFSLQPQSAAGHVGPSEAPGWVLGQTSLCSLTLCICAEGGWSLVPKRTGSEGTSSPGSHHKPVDIGLT